jgi:hypothetical protein
VRLYPQLIGLRRFTGQAKDAGMRIMRYQHNGTTFAEAWAAITLKSSPILPGASVSFNSDNYIEAHYAPRYPIKPQKFHLWSYGYLRVK